MAVEAVNPVEASGRDVSVTDPPKMVKTIIGMTIFLSAVLFAFTVAKDTVLPMLNSAVSGLTGGTINGSSSGSSQPAGWEGV